MTGPSDGANRAEFNALRVLSARIGADPLLTQAAGGNTSIKDGDTLWIKASGTWLEQALSSDIMVPVALGPLRDAVHDGDPRAEKPIDFVPTENNPSGLRPSIETTLHAVMPQKVVVHVHCVQTIANAVRTDAETVLRERLQGMRWAFVPYVRPGLPLANAIAERLQPSTDVLVLGNHGLVVAAETVADSERLMAKVCGLLAQVPRVAPPPDLAGLARLAGQSGYRLPAMPETHAVATDHVSLRIAAGGSLYPDHVIFLGAGSIVAKPDEDAAGIEAACKARGQVAPTMLLFPGKGVLMRRDASDSAEALARCLAHVALRIPPDAPLRYLTQSENAELLGWDAEKYRQSLDARRSGEPR
ncbi:MAG: class II aldolase [Rhizobiaceae bacterium]|nr:MAG: class II aldolase [Rhizobiaceae bacterium]